MKPKEERIEHYRPHGEEFDKAYTYDYKSRTDDTETSQQRVQSEKINVYGGDIPRTEKTDKPRYPKKIDVGRIVIEETPEEKEQMTKDHVLKRDEVAETRYKVKRGPTREVKEDVKVGRIDTADYEMMPTQSEGIEERVTTFHTAKQGKYEKVNI